MTDIIDSSQLASRERKRKKHRNIQLTLLAIATSCIIIQIAAICYVIPAEATWNNSSWATGISVRLFISLVPLLASVLGSFLLSLLLAALPVGKSGYYYRLRWLFLTLWCIAEIVICTLVLLDSWHILLEE